MSMFFGYRPSQLTVLRTAMGVLLLLGGGLVLWLAEQARRHPEIQAAQADATAPLWIPMMLFVAVCVGALVVILYRASRRVSAGEDLFAQRHRRHPSEKTRR